MNKKAETRAFFYVTPATPAGDVFATGLSEETEKMEKRVIGSAVVRRSCEQDGEPMNLLSIVVDASTFDALLEVDGEVELDCVTMRLCIPARELQLWAAGADMLMRLDGAGLLDGNEVPGG